MSKRLYPQNSAVPTYSGQAPPSNFPGQAYQNVPGYPGQGAPQQRMGGYPGHGAPQQRMGGYPSQQFPGQPPQNLAGPPMQNFPQPTSQNYPGLSAQHTTTFTGQPTQNYPGQPTQSYPGQPPQNYPGQRTQTYQQPTQNYLGQPTQNYPGYPAQPMTGPPSSSSVPALASRVQQVQLGPPGQPPSMGQTAAPPSTSEQPFPPPPTLGHQGQPPPPPTSGHQPTLGQPPPPPTSGHQPTLGQPPPPPTSGHQPTLGQPPPPPTSGQPLHPTSTSGLSYPPTPTSGQQTLPPPSSGQTHPYSQTLAGQRFPSHTTGQTYHRQTSGQTQPPSGQALPPPPTSGQVYAPQPTSGQALPPPPKSGQAYAPPTSGQALPPPPMSGQAYTPPTSGQALPPPPMSGQVYVPPTSGQALPPPPMSGQAYTPPTSGQALPPPPKSGQVYVPPTSGQVLPPPPKSGQVYAPLTSGQALPPPPTSGQVYAPPPTSGQVYAPPPPSGQVYAPPPPSGQPFPAGPHVLGQRLPTGPPGSGPAGQSMARGPLQPGTPPATPGAISGAVATDPELIPVNLLENRNIVPPTPLQPPAIVLPGNMGQFCPKPSVFCCTMNAIPANNGLLNKLKLPLAIHIHPYKEMPVQECPVFQPAIIVRCRVCRAYINPYVTFMDSRHWRCNLCFRPNSLPEDFDFNPHTGRHGDRSHRLELRRSSVEYIAPSEYMLRPPQPSVYYFVIDVSYPAIETGLLGVFCRMLLDSLDRLPGDARTLFGILTFDSTLHFYNLSPGLSQPQMLVVSDLEDVFLPCPSSLLVNLRQSKELVRTLLEDLPGMFATNMTLKSALGPALQAAEKLLHPIGGRVTVMQSSLPNAGPGALKYRDVTPSAVKKDSLNMAPASDFYKKLALDCSSQQIAVDLFVFSGQFIDLSTISCISKFSAGQVFYYPDFHQKREAPRQKFEKDLRRYLTRRIGFEAVMRIRCTEGISMHTFHGNFFVRSTDLLSMPNVNPDHGYTMNIAIDDNLKEIGTVCFQAALLYTSSRGERRIRVHTLCLPVTTQLSHIYARLNIQAIAGVLANMAVDRSASASLGDAREALMNVVTDCTKMYRANFASSMQASQFNLPASLRLLPLFMLSLLKHHAFTLNSKISYDVRAQAMNLIKSLPLDYLIANIYPRMYALHLLTEKDVIEENDSERVAPPILHLSAEKMTRYGIFLMDYGLGLYIWVSKDSPQALIEKIFGVKHFGAIPETMVSLPSLENDASVLVNRLVKQIRASRQHFMPLLVVREDGPHRLLFIDKLVEDRTEDGTSYYEFLSHLNRQLSK